MEVEKLIEQAEKNIRQALDDYAARTYQTDVLDDIGDEFIERLAEDSTYAKQELRELFSKSPVWHPELDALIINGTRTHDPDYLLVRRLANKILAPAKQKILDDRERLDTLMTAIEFFAMPDDEEMQELGIAAIKELAPHAYHPGKKRSRIFKALCQALGVADETVGSDFQHLYAQFADEISSRKIDFKLFVSINPAHFLTMSNPKEDRRGSTLTSCHSLNSTEYEYNCGCAGYARDKVSFIVFTVDDPKKAESLNNRKTTRQIFAYKPGNGVLLQSRMYDTSGGVNKPVQESKLYRDLIQREISALENQPNLWKTYDACESDVSWLVRKCSDFGGYPDWKYSNFNCKICVRAEAFEDGEIVGTPLTIGESGLCVVCGEEICAEMYCDICRQERYEYHCDDCGAGTDDEEDIELVYDEEGHERWVCDRCLSDSYTSCDHCGQYHANSVMERVDGLDVCPDCLRDRYTSCDYCGDYCLNEESYSVRDENDNELWVCDYCRRTHYEICDECGEYVDPDQLTEIDAGEEYGSAIHVCGRCFDRFYSDTESVKEAG